VSCFSLQEKVDSCRLWYRASPWKGKIWQCVPCKRKKF